MITTQVHTTCARYCVNRSVAHITKNTLHVHAALLMDQWYIPLGMPSVERFLCPLEDDDLAALE